MNYITLDLEWNQAYQEKAIAVQKRLATRLRGEVIQIGAVKMNENGDICGSYSMTVKPRYYKRILKHVAKLTGITQERIDRGVPLPEAAQSFRRFCGEDFVFLTWGPDDIPMLEDNFRIHNLDTSWLKKHYDLQPIFNRQFVGGKNQKSLEFAMEYFGIPQNLPAHDALNDAYFTALVTQKLDMKRGIAEYPERKGDYLYDAEIGNADVGEDGFVEAREVFSAHEITDITCPLCGSPVEKEKMLHFRGQRYTACITCAEHGAMMLNIKLLHNFNDTFRAHVYILPADEDTLAGYRERLKEVPVRKRPRRRHSRKKTTAESTETSPVATSPAENKESKAPLADAAEGAPSET